MFELHGIFDLSTRRLALPPIPALPALAWSGVANREHRVAGQGLVAHYAEHPIGVPSYAMDGGLHAFVVGEARLRSDAPPAAIAVVPVSGIPLTAPQILALVRRAPGRFLDWLKGDFTLVFADEAARRVTIHNGRFGIMPFYYARDGERALFSTSLAAIGTTLSRRPSPDTAAAVEAQLFNFPLGRRTFLRGVSSLRPAETVEIDASGLRRRFHWDVLALLDRPHLPADEALDLGASLFRRTVNDLAADQRRVCLSFTAGFDSRTVLGVLDRDQGDLLGYAFGVASSPNVTIPRRLAGRIGLPFLPIILGDDYARDFDDYARRAVLLSDGLSTLERANYPYAFERAGAFAPVVLSGLFGSELLRTFQNVGAIVGVSLLRLNAAADPLAALDALLAEPQATGAGAPASGVEAAVRDAVRADVREVFLDRFAGMPPDRRFHMLLLTEVLRKYFGAEVAMERPYAANRAPYLDDEFVEFLFCAPFAGIHSRALRPTIANRYRSQYFYAHTLRTYRPELLGATTDHGFPPGDLLSPIAPLLIGPKVLYRRWRRRRGEPEFRTEEWTAGFYRRWFAARPRDENGQLGALARAFADGSWRTRRPQYARAVSLALWHEAVAP